MPKKQTRAELEVALWQAEQLNKGLASALQDAEKRALPEYVPVRGFTPGRAPERWYVGRIAPGGYITLVAQAANELGAHTLIRRMGILENSR